MVVVWKRGFVVSIEKEPEGNPPGSGFLEGKA